MLCNTILSAHGRHANRLLIGQAPYHAMPPHAIRHHSTTLCGCWRTTTRSYPWSGMALCSAMIGSRDHWWDCALRREIAGVRLSALPMMTQNTRARRLGT